MAGTLSTTKSVPLRQHRGLQGGGSSGVREQADSIVTCAGIQARPPILACCQPAGISCNPDRLCAAPTVPSCAHPQGLGTSTAAEAKQYFANILSHRKEFVWDGERCCCCCCQRLMPAMDRLAHLGRVCAAWRMPAHVLRLNNTLPGRLNLVCDTHSRCL